MLKLVLTPSIVLTALLEKTQNYSLIMNATNLELIGPRELKLDILRDFTHLAPRTENEFEEFEKKPDFILSKINILAVEGIKETLHRAFESICNFRYLPYARIYFQENADALWIDDDHRKFFHPSLKLYTTENILAQIHSPQSQKG